MSTDHAISTSDYLISTQSVLHAGRRLRSVLDADQATLEYAITRLERAAQQQQTGVTTYRAFMFSELATTTEEETETRERLTEDTLASVLTDLQVANVLMAAGQSLGETGGKAEPRLLDEALLRLENTTRVLDRSLPSPLAQGAQPGRFGFTEEMTTLEAVQSADLPSAIGTFQQWAQDTIVLLVNEAHGVVTGVFTSLSKLDKDKIMAALSNLGGQVEELPRIGRLFRWGVEKLKDAMTALISALGSEAISRMKDRVEKIWQDVKEGKYIAEALEWAFGVKATRTHIEEILGSDNLKPELLDQDTSTQLKIRFDEASYALSQLAIRFKENMTMARGLTSAVTLAGTVLALTPLAGPTLALLAASAYVGILAAVVLLGMDYTDSGGILRRVRGVGEIASSVLPR